MKSEHLNVILQIVAKIRCLLFCFFVAFKLCGEFVYLRFCILKLSLYGEIIRKIFIQPECRKVCRQKDHADQYDQYRVAFRPEDQ